MSAVTWTGFNTWSGPAAITPKAKPANPVMSEAAKVETRKMKILRHRGHPWQYPTCPAIAKPTLFGPRSRFGLTLF
jgi:hypothetical protein